MREEMNASEWQMGLIWLPGFVPHVAGVYLTVKLNRSYPKYQWFIAALGLLIQGFMCVSIPFCNSFILLMIPISGICFGRKTNSRIIKLFFFFVLLRQCSS